MIKKLITRKRELPLCWHFALTVIGVGAWCLLIAGPAISGYSYIIF